MWRWETWVLAEHPSHRERQLQTQLKGDNKNVVAFSECIEKQIFFEYTDKKIKVSPKDKKRFHGGGDILLGVQGETVGR